MVNTGPAGPVTNFQYGVSTAAWNSTLANYGMPDPSVWHTYFEDFDYYVSGDWTATATGSASEALADGDGGRLLLTNAAALNDAVYLQKLKESFTLAVGKQAFFKAKFQVSSATNATALMGLQITDTTPLTATDGIYFEKDSGAATLDFICRKNTTTGSNKVSAIATLTDATDVTVGWWYDGGTRLQYFVNDVLLGGFDPTNYLPDAGLNVSFGVENGTAAATTMNVDYIFAAQQR